MFYRPVLSCLVLCASVQVCLRLRLVWVKGDCVTRGSLVGSSTPHRHRHPTTGSQTSTDSQVDNPCCLSVSLPLSLLPLCCFPLALPQLRYRRMRATVSRSTGYLPSVRMSLQASGRPSISAMSRLPLSLSSRQVTQQKHCVLTQNMTSMSMNKRKEQSSEVTVFIRDALLTLRYLEQQAGSTYSADGDVIHRNIGNVNESLQALNPNGKKPKKVRLFFDCYSR